MVEQARVAIFAQELLHGMASPIQNLHLRIKAPIHEEAIMVDGVPTPGMSTPENRQSPNDTITNETVGSNALHGMNVSCYCFCFV